MSRLYRSLMIVASLPIYHFLLVLCLASTSFPSRYSDKVQNLVVRCGVDPLYGNEVIISSALTVRRLCRLLMISSSFTSLSYLAVPDAEDVNCTFVLPWYVGIML